MLIKIEYSDDSMWGDHNLEGVNVEASYTEFEKQMGVALRGIWPTVDVEFENNGHDRCFVNGESDHPEIPWVETVIGTVWSDFNWVVKSC